MYCREHHEILRDSRNFQRGNTTKQSNDLVTVFENSLVPQTNIIEWLQKKSNRNVLWAAIDTLQDPKHIKQFREEYIARIKEDESLRLLSDEKIRVVANQNIAYVVTGYDDKSIAKHRMAVLDDISHPFFEKEVVTAEEALVI